MLAAIFAHAPLLHTALAWCTFAHRAQQGRSDVQVDSCASSVRNAGGLHLKLLGRMTHGACCAAGHSRLALVHLRT